MQSFYVIAVLGSFAVMTFFFNSFETNLAQPDNRHSGQQTLRSPAIAENMIYYHFAAIEWAEANPTFSGTINSSNIEALLPSDRRLILTYSSTVTAGTSLFTSLDLTGLNFSGQDIGFHLVNQLELPSAGYVLNNLINNQITPTPSIAINLPNNTPVIFEDLS